MPRIKDGHNRERFKCKTQREIGIVERAKEQYRDSGHDMYEFVHNFFGVPSTRPSTYVCNIMEGKINVTLETWNKLVDYVSKPSGK